MLTQFDNNYNRYHGVDFVYNRRFDGRWLLMASMTLQDNYGRVGDYLNRNEREIFAYGGYGLDASALGKIVTTFALPWKLSASFFYRYAGGMNSNNQEVPDMARKVQVRDVTTGTLYPHSGRGAGQLPSGRYEHLRRPCVEEVRRSAAIARSRLLVDAFNITNANNILATGVITGSDLNVPLRIVTRRVFRLGAKFEF